MYKDGGAAFPRPDERGPMGEGIREGADGMTLRDWFAGQALSGICATLTADEIEQLAEGVKGGRLIVGAATALADKMIKEWEERNGQ